MREPVFNETLQLGIVVRDLEATMRRYVDDYGIGPWEVYEFDAGKAEDFASTISRSSAPGALLSPRSSRCSGS
jgi:Glyoxalase/Bleomycin resistance protein/Dioxygenase superfamily